MTPRASSYCLDGSCVHVQMVGQQVLVMASPSSRQALVFDHQEWAAFIAGVRNGEFDLDALAEPKRPAPGPDAVGVPDPAKPQAPTPNGDDNG